MMAPAEGYSLTWLLYWLGWLSASECLQAALAERLFLNWTDLVKVSCFQLLTAITPTQKGKIDFQIWSNKVVWEMEHCYEVIAQTRTLKVSWNRLSSLHQTPNSLSGYRLQLEMWTFPLSPPLSKSGLHLVETFLKKNINSLISSGHHIQHPLLDFFNYTDCQEGCEEMQVLERAG